MLSKIYACVKMYTEHKYEEKQISWQRLPMDKKEEDGSGKIYTGVLLNFLI